MRKGECTALLQVFILVFGVIAVSYEIELVSGQTYPYAADTYSSDYGGTNLWLCDAEPGDTASSKAGCAKSNEVPVPESRKQKIKADSGSSAILTGTASSAASEFLGIKYSAKTLVKNGETVGAIGKDGWVNLDGTKFTGSTEGVPAVEGWKAVGSGEHDYYVKCIEYSYNSSHSGGSGKGSPLKLRCSSTSLPVGESDGLLILC